jgi:hypothetical protein
MAHRHQESRKDFIFGVLAYVHLITFNEQL